MITLRQSVIDQIKHDKGLKIAIQSTLNISHTTMYKYLNSNDSKLANMNVVKMLISETGLSEDQIVTV